MGKGGRGEGRGRARVDAKDMQTNIEDRRTESLAIADHGVPLSFGCVALPRSLNHLHVYF